MLCVKARGMRNEKIIEKSIGIIIKIRVDWAVTIIIAAVTRHICMRMAYVRMEAEARRSGRLTRRRRRR